MDYIAEANLTKSNQFHGELVGLDYLKSVVRQSIVRLNELDLIKKALFYGKVYDQIIQPLTGERDSSNITNVFGSDKQVAIDIIHSIIGKATEAGELLELLIGTINGEVFDVTNFKEEIGDGMWYDAIALKAIGSDFPTEQKRNIDKLRKRYGEKFTEYDANNRDLASERKTLET